LGRHEIGSHVVRILLRENVKFFQGRFHVTTSFLNTYEGTRAIWNAQTAGIVAGHVLAVLLAHELARRSMPSKRALVLSQLPLAVVMVGYTLFGLWLLSWPSRWRWIRRLELHSERLQRASAWTGRLGSDISAMHVELHGYRRTRKLGITWTLVAAQGDGTQVPCAAAIVLAQKLATGTLVARGAMPCLGLFSLEECLRTLEPFDVHVTIERVLD